MNEFHQQASAQGVPCALHHYLFVTYGKDTIGALPKDECVKAFQYWVDNLRSYDSASHIKEHLMCPMLWCRDTFEDQLETMNHVPTCCWLSDTWYWCPSCSRPETFMDCGGTGGQVPLQRKESRLKRAMTFFKHFGRRTSIKGKIAWPNPPARACELADTSRYAFQDVKAMDHKDPKEMDCVARVYEMARRNSRHLPSWPELSSRLSHVVQHEMSQPDEKHTFDASPPWAELTGSQPTIAVQPLHEMYDPSIPIAELPSRLSHNVQHELPQPEDKQAFAISPRSAELPTHHSHTVQGDIFRAKHGLAGHTAEHVSDEFLDIDGWGHTVPSDHDTSLSWLVSPRASIVSSFSEGRTFSSPKLSPQSSRPTIPALSRPEPICYLPQDRLRLWTAMVTSVPHMNTETGPSRADDKSSEYDPPSYANRPETFSWDGESTRMQPLIEELRELVFIVNTEWLQRLAPYEDLCVLCSSSSVRNLFELGMKALKQCFDGSIVTTFTDVFALMHVACASAYMLHRDNESYCWDKFLNDMLAWQYAIVEESERLVFVGVMDRLSTPQGIPTLPSNASYCHNWHPSGALLDVLRNGRVVENCSTMLTDLDHGRILERTKHLLPEHFASYAHMEKANIAEMIEKVTQPLQRKDGLEAFRNIVVDIESRLRKGLLQNPWEVEVALLSNGRLYSRSPQMYQRFQEAVSVLCGDPMRKLNPTWRNRYYATVLEQGLAISLEIDKRQKPGSPLLAYWPNVSVLDVVRPNQAISVSPTLSDENSANVSPITTGSASSIQSSQRSAGESTLTSPTTVGTDSDFSILSPSTPIRHENVARCDECDKTFTGASCATNLQRHRKYDKPHNKVPTFECFYQDCKKKFSRSDNRNQHVQGAHPSSAAVQSWRREATKRRREAEDDAGREAVAAEFV